jgi:dienelactone hydrolase
MLSFNRRALLALSLAAAANLSCAQAPERKNVHEQILELAAEQEQKRRQRFAAVKSKEDLAKLQAELHASFLELIGRLPTAKGPPRVEVTGTIDADGYTIDKLVYESLPSYFVPALLYKPKDASGPCPATISPCGHSATGKAAEPYQILHINLAKRGYVVLTYDPVGQGERSQFWDADKQKSRYNLTCGEHAVLGNPLYLLGSSLARYRIWDGMRGIDLLASLKEVDAKRIGCVGNSGGGTLTAYISALDPRVACAAICCYITTLPRRMANRIEADPDSDPEQDIFNFVGAGIDHAGLVALRAPRPTLLGTARFDFFPIEGARETFDEARQLFAAAGAGEKLERVEALEKHGLTPPLREAVYRWFDHWLAGKKTSSAEEIKVTPRSAKELLVCKSGQVNIDFKSKHLLPLALEEFTSRPADKVKPTLKELLPFRVKGSEVETTEVAGLRENGRALVLFVNGNDSPDWRQEKEFLSEIAGAGYGVRVLDPRGVGKLRLNQSIRGQDYANPLVGVEANIAYNAFLVGQSLVRMRVADLQFAPLRYGLDKSIRMVLCGRGDAALVCVLAAAVCPQFHAVATEGLLLDFRDLFTADARPINAASILPNLLRCGNMADILAEIAPRKVLAAAPVGKLPKGMDGVTIAREGLAKDARAFIEWLPK